MSSSYPSFAPSSLSAPSAPAYQAQPLPNMPSPAYAPVAYPPTYTPLQIQPGQPLPMQPVPVNSSTWGKAPQMTTCPFCRTMAPTHVKFERGLFTWASCIGISLLGLNAGCCLVPFCIDEFKDSYHYCQVCNALLGVRKPLS
jgi:lipopolysaccharide-induced tumor necrosis factor-alpha factor